MTYLEERMQSQQLEILSELSKTNLVRKSVDAGLEQIQAFKEQVVNRVDKTVEGYR